MPVALEEVFDFFSKAENLERLTPESPRFETTSPLPIDMNDGATIDYRLRLLGAPIRWQIVITIWEPPSLFANDQIRGPYQLWHLGHRFAATESSKEIIDQVQYRVAGGCIKPLVHALLVGPQLKQIFKYCAEIIREVFTQCPSIKPHRPQVLAPRTRHPAPYRRFWRENRTGLLFISPWLFGFLMLQVWPFIGSAWLSLTSYDIVSAPRYVGMENYRTLLQDDPAFWNSIVVTIRYAVISVPLNVVAGVCLALLLNVEFRGQSLFRTIFYLPAVLPQVATAVVFSWLLNPEIGVVNGILRLVGIEGPAWLTDAHWAPWTLVLLSVWGVGGSMVIYLAGLKDVPTYLYEAATLDGAKPWQRLRNITLPMLTPVIFFNVVMGVIGSFQAFTEAFVMTKGGPEGSTTFYALYLFNRAWANLDMGYACAMAWVLFLAIGVTTLLLFRSQNKWVTYDR